MNERIMRISVKSEKAMKRSPEELLVEPARESPWAPETRGKLRDLVRLVCVLMLRSLDPSNERKDGKGEPDYVGHIDKPLHPVIPQKTSTPARRGYVPFWGLFCFPFPISQHAVVCVRQVIFAPLHCSSIAMIHQAQRIL
jgi:hypothetical protein